MTHSETHTHTHTHTHTPTHCNTRCVGESGDNRRGRYRVVNAPSIAARKSKEKDDDTIAGNNPKTLSAPFSGPPRLHFFSSHLVVVVVVVVVVVDVVGYILLGLVSLG